MTIRDFEFRETATLLAALRMWQRLDGPAGNAPEMVVATNDGAFAPLDEQEIDDLCEAINMGDVLCGAIRVGSFDLVNAASRAPSVLLVDAYIPGDDIGVAGCPSFAVFELTPSFVCHVLELRATAVKLRLAELCVDAADVVWGPKATSEALRLNSSRLVVTADDFWFETWPRYESYQIETRPMDFAVLTKARSAEGWGTKEKPHYCGDAGAMEYTLEVYADEEGCSTEDLWTAVAPKTAAAAPDGTRLGDDAYELILEGLQHLRGEKVDALHRAAAAQPSNASFTYTAESFGIPQLDELIERLGTKGADLFLTSGD
jgi:hypothetical protein